MCSLIVGNVFLVLFNVSIAMPCFLLALLSAVSGGHFYHLTSCGHYLILTGTVLNVERTTVLRHPKAVLMEVEGIALRVVLRNRHKSVVEGSRLSFYVQDNTPIYEWGEMHLLSSYLAVEDGTSSKSA